jgi:hypothetical protein
MSELKSYYDMTQEHRENPIIFAAYVAAVHWARQVGLSCTGITESITVQRAQRPAEPLGRQLSAIARH